MSPARQGGHNFHSQAECAGSIPVTRSTRGKRCSTIELEDPSFLLIRVFGRCLGCHPSASQDAQLVPFVFQGLGSSNRTGIFGGFLHGIDGQAG